MITWICIGHPNNFLYPTLHKKRANKIRWDNSFKSRVSVFSNLPYYFNIKKYYFNRKKGCFTLWICPNIHIAWHTVRHTNDHGEIVWHYFGCVGRVMDCGGGNWDLVELNIKKNHCFQRIWSVTIIDIQVSLSVLQQSTSIV